MSNTSNIQEPASKKTVDCSGSFSPNYELTEKPDVVQWKPAYYVYVEKKGHFLEVAQEAWCQFFANVDKIDAQVTREKHMSVYRMDSEPWIYRAGYTVSSKPATLPDGFNCTELEGGSYLRFTMTGGYNHLAEANKRVYSIVDKQYENSKRKDWNIEYYVNNIKNVKPEKLVTEILIPIKSESQTCQGGNHATSSTYQLTEKPQSVEWKPYHYVYVEKKGEFKDTAKACWDALKAHLAEIKAQTSVDKFIAQYRTDTDPWVYRAGVTVSSPPQSLPDGYHVSEFSGGSFLSFTMTGGYNNLPEACGRVYDIVGKHHAHEQRRDWNIEYYVNDPNQVKPDELITEILIPIKSSADSSCQPIHPTSATYQLTEEPEFVEWKSYHYVYVEKKGHFKDTAKACWDEMNTRVAEIKAQTSVDKFIAQYRTDTDPWVYRAGVTVPSPPATIPHGCQVSEFAGGSFLSFTMTGGYNHLPQACGRVCDIVASKYQNQVRSDWYLEYYVNDPTCVKPDHLVTQILVPIHNKN